jgi:hypothetical protein
VVYHRDWNSAKGLEWSVCGFATNRPNGNG